MFTCKDCGHSEMVHHMFAGCCHVKDCGCLGMDGFGPHCEPVIHAFAHNAFVELPAPKTHLEYLERIKGHTVTDTDRSRISALLAEGHGSRTIARDTGINRAVVIAVIRELRGGPGPATQPRTRPREVDRQRALAVGITPEEFQAERVEGGRARTIAGLDAWIAERAAG